MKKNVKSSIVGTLKILAIIIGFPIAFILAFGFYIIAMVNLSEKGGLISDAAGILSVIVYISIILFVIIYALHKNYGIKTIITDVKSTVTKENIKTVATNSGKALLIILRFLGIFLIFITAAILFFIGLSSLTPIGVIIILLILILLK